MKTFLVVLGIAICFSFQVKGQYSEYSLRFSGETMHHEWKATSADSNYLHLPMEEKIKEVEFNVPLSGVKNIEVKSYEVIFLRGKIDSKVYDIVGEKFPDEAIEDLNSGKVTSIVLRKISASYLQNGTVLSLPSVTVIIK